jgi:uncharacterized protein (DUF2237 family)
VAYSARGVIYTARADGSGRPARMADGGCPTWTHDRAALVTCASAARSPSESVRRAGASVRAKLPGRLFVGGISPDDGWVLFSGGPEGGSDADLERSDREVKAAGGDHRPPLSPPDRAGRARARREGDRAGGRRRMISRPW